MIHITSDTHDSHKNILGFESCDKYRYDLYGDKSDPESVLRMNNGIVKIWNSTVKPTDTVYHLGDVSLAYGKKAEPALRRFLDQVNGHIILLRGNHDHKMTKKVFLEYGHEVRDYVETEIEGNKVVMSHYPMLNWNKKHHGSIMLHGHEHGAIRDSEVSRGKTMDVGWDCWGRPLNIREIFVMMEGRHKFGVGHHGT